MWNKRDHLRIGDWSDAPGNYQMNFECWLRLWDTALEFGWIVMTGLQTLNRTMDQPDYGSWWITNVNHYPCHLCNVAPWLEKSVLDPILTVHWKELHLNLKIDTDVLLGMLSTSELEVLSKLKSMLDIIHNFTHLFLDSLHICIIIRCYYAFYTL